MCVGVCEFIQMNVCDHVFALLLKQTCYTSAFIVGKSKSVFVWSDKGESLVLREP